MKSLSTEKELRQSVVQAADAFAGDLLEKIVEADDITRADEWMKEAGGELLRRLLGQALMLRAERRAKQGPCASPKCDGRTAFKQRRPFELHTVVPGRDVAMVLPYAVCPKCRTGSMPLLDQMRTDPEGFTPALRELSLLAATEHTYEQAAESTLPKYAGVEVSRDKLHALVHEHAQLAEETMREAPPETKQAEGVAYVGIDGGMAFVDKAWQEIKLGILFDAEEFVRKGPKDRGHITAKRVVGVRGDPDDLAALLQPHAEAFRDREVVVLGDGAKWIWNLADRLFPNRTEILDWYHVDEHICAAGRVIHGEDTQAYEKWRALQLERLAHDEVDDVLTGLAFLVQGSLTKAAREAAGGLHDYLAGNRHRVRYKTFRDRGLRIGSGFVESAVNHVMQQRMKRTGMRWHADGADAMLALRCVYRTTGGWDRLRVKSRLRGTG